MGFSMQLSNNQELNLKAIGETLGGRQNWEGKKVGCAETELKKKKTFQWTPGHTG